MPSADSVARYYDSNTRRFLAVGGGGRTHSIHRHLWGPGVHTTEGAAAHVNHLLTARIVELSRPADLTILDMGCGVGGTLFHLADAFERSRLHGITISETQCEIGARLATRRGLDGRCSFHLGDFLSAPLAIEADVIVAVESFVHAARPERFLEWAAERLTSGGHLLLVDDFLGSRSEAAGDEGWRHIEEFRTGWHAPAVCTVDRLLTLALGAGLQAVTDIDLTHMIRLGRPRDRAIAAVSPLFRRLGLARVPFFGNMIGGNALQYGLRNGLFEYRFVVLRRPS